MDLEESLMKLGDLVAHRVGGAPRGRSDSWLYGGDELPWDPIANNMIPSDVPFHDGDLGIILRTAIDPVADHRIFHKILTSNGVGWVRENLLEVVSETR